jgi:hypothetical protein
VALDFWVEPVLELGEHAGATLGALYASTPAPEAVSLPPPSAEEVVVPLNDSELQEVDANPAADAPASKPAATGAGKSKRSGTKAGKAGSKAQLPVPKHGIRVSQASVLRLARARVIPSGQFVAASGARPSGLKLSGTSALGIGVADGDVLTHVSGVPVTDKGQVVNLVLQARARNATQIAGRFYRGEEPWLLLVEMPYLPRSAGK